MSLKYISYDYYYAIKYLLLFPQEGNSSICVISEIIAIQNRLKITIQLQQSCKSEFSNMGYLFNVMLL